MMSMWNAPSDRDYYGESEAEFWERENEQWEERAAAEEEARNWNSLVASEVRS